MPRVADYVIIRDSWDLDNSATNPNTFTVPNNIDVGSRCVLSFMFDVETLGAMEFWIAINGTDVWSWSATGSASPPMRCMQEVVASQIVRPGENILQFGSAGDWRTIRLSDIVLWIQVNV